MLTNVHEEGDSNVAFREMDDENNHHTIGENIYRPKLVEALLPTTVGARVTTSTRKSTEETRVLGRNPPIVRGTDAEKAPISASRRSHGATTVTVPLSTRNTR